MGEAHAISLCARVGVKVLHLSGIQIDPTFINEVMMRLRTKENGFISNLTS